MISRFPVIDISPTTYFGGEFIPAKAIPHEAITVGATIIREGHEGFEAFALLFDSTGKERERNPMRLIWPGSDRYEGVLTPTDLGRWSFAIEVRDEKGIRSQSEKFPINAEDPRSLIGSWYEFFHGAREPRRIPMVQSPLEPSLRQSIPLSALQIWDSTSFTFLLSTPSDSHSEKVRTIRPLPEPGEPGVPWGIGSQAGGHDAINPELGTLEDFQRFVAAAKKLNIEIALDLALQCSPDHPWAKEHQEWFTKRADGTIAYAENPPKKYQDIYPINFDNDYQGLLAEVLRIIRYWISQGIKAFRVDNPHTKPVHFWQECHCGDQCRLS
jgi:starch synthase (maltosyl-transferring)